MLEHDDLLCHAAGYIGLFIPPGFFGCLLVRFFNKRLENSAEIHEGTNSDPMGC
ncbi:hypothetical protein D3C78_1820550 [compost metagenome]